MSKAVETAGRHLTDGKLLYDLRLEYEEAILATMQVSVCRYHLFVSRENGSIQFIPQLKCL